MVMISMGLLFYIFEDFSVENTPLLKTNIPENTGGVLSLPIQTISIPVPTLLSFDTLKSQLDADKTLTNTVSEAPKGTIIKSPMPDKIVITFDICSPYSGIWKANLLHSLDIIAQETEYPVTIFVAGIALQDKDIKAKIIQLSHLPHVSLQPHGMHHYALTALDKTAHFNRVVRSTGNLQLAYREMLESAQEIEKITGKRSQYIRSPGLITDEKVTKMADLMRLTMVGRTTEGGNECEDGGGGKKGKVEKMNFHNGVLFLGHAINIDGVEAVYKKLDQEKWETTFLDGIPKG
ncbi:MAG: polysaccharide deacetylase family protein [Candidatus Peregrinibacteria bacterium]